MEDFTNENHSDQVIRLHKINKIDTLMTCIVNFQSNQSKCKNLRRRCNGNQKPCRC